MRFKKAEIEEFWHIIHESTDTNRREYAWSMLCYDHWRRLRIDLDHIGSIPLIDHLEADSLESDGISTALFFTHYKPDLLENIESYLIEAERGIKYLRKLIEAEKESRKRNVIQIVRKGD